LFRGDSDAVVTLNGVNIPLVQISAGELAGNVSAFAGNSAQLTFPTTTGGAGGDGLYFDDIQFSPLAVPEPNSFGLFALGGLFVTCCHWRKSASRVC